MDGYQSKMLLFFLWIYKGWTLSAGVNVSHFAREGVGLSHNERQAARGEARNPGRTDEGALSRRSK
jgi:hypothetical protein